MTHRGLGMPALYVVSLGDRIWLDMCAWRSPIFVFVKLTTLGIDHTLRGDLEQFMRKVVARYYREGTRVPMFQVDFGDGIGCYEVSVKETQLDNERTFRGKTRRVLQYNEGCYNTYASPSRPTIEPCAPGQRPFTPIFAYCIVEPDYDSALDYNWRGEQEDFNCSGVSSLHGSPNSFIEEPLEKLRMYDENEDRHDSSFKRRYVDSQWQETCMFYRSDTNNFSGPPLGLVLSATYNALDYFRRFWTYGILDCIVTETNTFVPAKLQ